MTQPTLTPTEVAADVCRLVTRGRRSGEAHDIEIWFSTTGSTVYFVSGDSAASDWYRNALADPEVEIRVGDRRFVGNARPVDHADERRLVGELMDDKYRGDLSGGRESAHWLWEASALGVDLASAGPA